MAGIGFTLRRMLSDEGFSGPLQAFAYATVISSGPWLTSSVTLALLGVWSALGVESHDSQVFLALVSYAFTFSLVGVGALQMAASRYLADRLYLKETDVFAPAFTELLGILLTVQLVVACGFLSFVPLGFLIKGVAIALYLALNGTWLAMVFLSAANDYRAITLAFAGGWAMSFLLGWYGSHHGGLEAQLLGFTAGVVLTFFILLGRMDREFGLPVGRAIGMWASFKQHWALAFTGFAYNLATWVDKLLFWYHPGVSVPVAGALRIAPVYDNAMFLAYLTIIPSLALFLLKVETDFYDQYRRYFATIAARASLSALLSVKDDMVRVLKSSAGLLVKVQGAITFALVALAPEVASVLKLSWLSIFVFRTGVFGAFLHVLHLIVLILLLYFDFRREAAILAGTYLAANLAFSGLSLLVGLPAFAFGYTVANAFTLLIGFWLLDHRLGELEYHVFMKQPI